MKVRILLKKYSWLWLTIWVLLVFWFFRQHLFFNLWQDEPYTLMAVKAISEFGLPQLPSGLYYTRALAYNYIVGFWSSACGANEICLRLPSLFFAWLFVLTIFVFLKQKIPTSISLIASGLLSVSPWFLTYAFFARPYMMQILLYAQILLNVYLYVLTNYQKTSYLAINAFLFAVAGFLSPTTILYSGIIVWLMIVKLQQKRFYGFSTILLIISLVFIFGGALVPGTVALSSQLIKLSDQTKNASFILPNLFFWKTLFSFFPLGSFLLLMSTLFFWYKRDLIVLLPIFLWISFVILSIINPFGNLQPRYLSIFMPIIFITLPIFIYELTKKRLIWWLLILVLALDYYYLPFFYQLNYGKPLKKTMVISLSWTELPDIKSPTEYLNKHYQKDDKVISLMPRGQIEAYSQVPINYWLRTTNYQSESILNKDTVIDSYFATTVIPNLKILKSIAKKFKNKRIWLVSSKSIDSKLKHLDQQTINWLRRHSELKYQGKEQYAQVYLIRYN